MKKSIIFVFTILIASFFAISNNFSNASATEKNQTEIVQESKEMQTFETLTMFDTEFKKNLENFKNTKEIGFLYTYLSHSLSRKLEKNFEKFYSFDIDEVWENFVKWNFSIEEWKIEKFQYIWEYTDKYEKENVIMLQIQL